MSTSSHKQSNIPRVVLAGVNSGCGKTTVATGIMAALQRRGLKVQGYKVGPDYIDPSYHTIATGRPSRNLDSWMIEHDVLRDLFWRSATCADISIIEGVMGMFDGHGGPDDSGSTAEVARLLKTPVVLVMDVSKLSRTAAALALGCVRFDPRLDIQGVILNKVGSPRHLNLVKEAIERTTGLTVLGYLPRKPEFQLPERHLGLVPAAEQEKLKAFLDVLAQEIEASVDIDRLLQLARKASPLAPAHSGIFPATPVAPKRVRIAVASDEAFNFYYQDNLDLLQAHGAELAFFSPLRDVTLPSGAQGLYLGGGFPEVYASQLSKNAAMRQAVRQAGAAGMAIYAECGGLMYLSEGVIDRQGDRNPMTGLVPGWASMQDTHLKLAYVEMTARDGNRLIENGVLLRGHEFHYSHLAPPSSDSAAWSIHLPEPRVEGFRLNNFIASYIHLHFATNRFLAPNFISWVSG